jgi:hypothetical protein
MSRIGILTIICTVVVFSAAGAVYYKQLSSNSGNNSSGSQSSGNNSSSSLPSYLSECVIGSLVYHAHAHLSIIINGQSQVIPAGTGIVGACLHPLHTHSTDGIIHIETDQNRTFTLGDFFRVWGQPFDTTHIMQYRFSQGQLNMTVSGTTNSALWDYVLPRNAESSIASCSDLPCQTVDIVITVNT